MCLLRGPVNDLIHFTKVVLREASAIRLNTIHILPLSLVLIHLTENTHEKRSLHFIDQAEDENMSREVAGVSEGASAHLWEDYC